MYAWRARLGLIKPTHRGVDTGLEFDRINTAGLLREDIRPLRPRPDLQGGQA